MSGTMQVSRQKLTYGLNHSISVGPFIVLVEKSLDSQECWKVTLYGSTEDTKACFAQHILMPDADGGVLDTYTAPTPDVSLEAVLTSLK
jgi:hypothetical protein